MLERTCEGCGQTFQTLDTRKRRCKKGCGRKNPHAARDKQREEVREYRNKYFKCGLPRDEWGTGTEPNRKCRHCRAVARARKALKTAPTTQRKYYEEQLAYLERLTPNA